MSGLRRAVRSQGKVFEVILGELALEAAGYDAFLDGSPVASDEKLCKSLPLRGDRCLFITSARHHGLTPFTMELASSGVSLSYF